MNSLDLDDSALCTLSVIQKRKATVGISLKKSKQAKLDISVTLKNSEQKRSEENSKLNESTSIYFKKKNSNMCPLCLKVIGSDGGFMTHTKSCAKKHNMTTKELLKALDLQKKHMEERSKEELPSQVIPWNKKINNKKTRKNMDSYDVALGIALSKSLEETKPAEKGKTTLEKFGFKATEVLTGTGPRVKQNKLLQKSVLKVRTAEERQRIITEKVAILLLDEDAENDVEEKTVEKVKPNEIVRNIANEVPHLWNLGENEGKLDWYTKAMKPLIQVDEEKVPETHRKEKIPSVFFHKDVENSVSQLNLPSENLSADWRKMINNSKLSDLVGRTKDSQTVYLHSLVLQARCANILEKDYKSVFGKFNLLTVLVFLEFLYCGTLNSLTGPEVNNLSLLAGEFDYEELIKVLNCLNSEGDEQNPREEITIIESDSEDKDPLEEDMVDLTQSSHSTNNEKHSEDETNIEKSYWSFIRQEKKREEELRKEEEKESSLLCIEREKIETHMKQRDEQMQKIIESEEESDFRDSLELEKICGSQRTSSPVPAFKENMSDCIILSSDSETRWSKPETQSPDLRIPSPPSLDYEIPCFDPYDDVIACSGLSPVNAHSESLLSGNVLCESPQPQDNKPGYCSTPVTKPRNSTADSSSKKPLVKKRRSNLSASRILRKSLHLQQPKKGNSISVKKKILKRKSIKENKSEEIFSNSVLHDLSKSFLGQASPPKSLKNFLELTPMPGKDEFGESVTPSPNYSKMGDSVLKEHLSRYGLKRSMGKSKAKKILRHIYEELHPLINTENGKIVKIMNSNTPNGKKNKTKKKIERKVAKGKAEEKKATCSNSSEETLKPLDESLDRSMCDSNGSEFEDLNEPLTQSLSNNSTDLPSAFREFIENNSEFYTKILMYEPIWLEDLQTKLKERFKKHFKLSDLMDYLDQKCITFRTQAQKNVNQKRAEKKQSPRKKTSS